MLIFFFWVWILFFFWVGLGLSGDLCFFRFCFGLRVGFVTFFYPLNFLGLSVFFIPGPIFFLVRVYSLIPSHPFFLF